MTILNRSLEISLRSKLHLIGIPAQLLAARWAVDSLTLSLIDRIIWVCSYKMVPVGVVDENVCGVIEELGAQVASD